MPLEINEIGIRMQVGGGPEGEPSAEAAAPGGGETPEVDREAIVEECVRRVVEILRAGRER